jgi:hypothetical protein
MTQRIRDEQVLISNTTVSGGFLSYDGDNFFWQDDNIINTISGVVFNEESSSLIDFRIESDTEPYLIFADSSEDSVYLGGVNNSVKITKGGELTLEGNSTRYEDLRIEPVARTTGTNAPSFEKWRDTGTGSRGVYLYSFDDALVASEKEIFFTMQTPHQIKLGAPISLHVHWIGNVNDTLASPRWGLEYTWKNIGEDFGTTNIIYTMSGNVTPLGTEYDIVQYRHYLSEFNDLTPDSSQDGLSSILIGRLFRNSSAVEDTYNETANKCGLLYIDFHYEVDSFGSSEEYIK